MARSRSPSRGRVAGLGRRLVLSRWRSSAAADPRQVGACIDPVPCHGPGVGGGSVAGGPNHMRIEEIPVRAWRLHARQRTCLIRGSRGRV
jgi:hypothetical protein